MPRPSPSRPSPALTALTGMLTQGSRAGLQGCWPSAGAGPRAGPRAGLLHATSTRRLGNTAGLGYILMDARPHTAAQGAADSQRSLRVQDWYKTGNKRSQREKNGQESRMEKS